MHVGLSMRGKPWSNDWSLVAVASDCRSLRYARQIESTGEPWYLLLSAFNIGVTLGVHSVCY